MIVRRTVERIGQGESTTRPASRMLLAERSGAVTEMQL